MNRSRAYISAAELTELTPWTPDAIEKMVRRGTLVRGLHYFQPFGLRSRFLFKWDAIVGLIEGAPFHSGLGSPVEGARIGATSVRKEGRQIDVEKAETSLQRLLA